MSEDLYALTLPQHQFLSQQHKESKTSSRPAMGVSKKEKPVPAGIARVMQIADDYPIYSPDDPVEVAVFVLGERNRVRTIEMSGDDLFGDIDVTVAGITYRLNSQGDTSAVRKKFGFNLDFCRVTVFPGMWEFAFSDEPPAMSVKAHDATGDNLFTGGLQVIQERWVSIDDNDGGVQTIFGTDSFPYLQGEVKRGSRALAHRIGASGWIFGQWQCRPFRFRPGVQ